MEVEATRLHQSQDSKSDEETNQAMTESLVCSGIQSSALCDESLSKEGEYNLLEVVNKKLPKDTNPATEVGKKLANMSDEMDNLITSNSYIDKMLRTLTNVTLQNELTQFFKEATKKVIEHKGGITVGCILVIVMFGYRLVKRYLELLFGERILQFIESIVKAIYEVFKEFGILNWIARIGGWAALAAWRMDSSIIRQISSGLTRELWGLLGIGAAAAAAFCAYKAISG